MLNLVDQNRIKDEILAERLALAESLMKECEVDAWIIASREYNEDPLFHALTPAHFPTARRVTILVLGFENGKYVKYCVNLPDHELEKYYVQDYDRKNETQMEALTRVLTRMNPRNIALNYSDHFAYTDGLSVGLYRLFHNELPKELTDKFISADSIGIRLLETRTAKELEVYPMVMDVAMEIIEKTFSAEQIIPGKTTCTDLMNFMEQETNNRGIYTWFDSTIDLQRGDGMHGEDTVIEKGDLLHCDFGIRYLNLCTDTQRLCYVLKDDEEDIPEELQKAFARNNRFQDIVREQMQLGKTGNEVFVDSIQQGKAEGIRPMLYTHPLGFHGHAAGPIIGLFSDQNPIPVRGDLKLYNHTGYALELNTTEHLDMYGRDTFIFTEESVIFVDNEVHFLAENRDKMYKVKG